ncbi:MAG: hypothetical protein V8S57_08120 [Oscillospiraceae bacterium]
MKHDPGGDGMTRGEAKAYRAAIVAAREYAVTEDNARLDIRVLFPDWAAGAHAVAGEFTM